MNRNDERIGVQTVSPREAFNREREEVINKSEPEKERVQAPPLTYLNPTQVIDLPSKGRHYEESHPLHGKDKVEIKQMTTVEENIMLNKSLQREGEAADKLFQSVLVDKGINTRSMLSCDRESIIIHSRIYSQGKNYPTTVVCPSCFEKVRGQLDLFKAIDIGLERLEQIEDVEKEFDIEWTGPRTYKMKLETTGWTVECKLLNGYDEKIQFEQEKKLEMLKKKDSKHPMVLEENEKSRLLRSLIVSIDGNDGAGPRKDRREINQAIDSMPSIDNRAITEVYKLINPRIALMKNIYCDKCGYEGVVEVPVGPDFFLLSDEYSESVYHMFHYMIYYGGWSLQELVALPCGLRKYFFEKLKETKEEEAKRDNGDRSQTSTGGNNALQDYHSYLGKNQ